MKITKAQLTKIIKEEYARLQEIVPPPPGGVYPEDEPEEPGEEVTNLIQWAIEAANRDNLQGPVIDHLNKALSLVEGE
jgi:hypothetical protein